MPYAAMLAVGGLGLIGTGFLKTGSDALGEANKLVKLGLVAGAGYAAGKAMKWW